MDAHELDALLGGDHDSCERAWNAASGVGNIAQLRDHFLAGGAQKDGHAEAVEDGEAGHHRDVVVEVFAKADARVDAEFGARDAGRLASLNAGVEKVVNVEREV